MQMQMQMQMNFFQPKQALNLKVGWKTVKYNRLR